MLSSKPTVTNIDEYIAMFPKDVQERLQKIRAVIKKSAPKAEEVISYKMPGFRLNGMLVWFAANKEHIGFYPTASPIIAFKKELAAYKTSKGAIQFPMEKPIPVGLVRDIVKFRINAAENTSKTKKR